MKYILLIVFMANSPGNGGVHIESTQVSMASSDLCELAKTQVLDGAFAQTFTPAGLARATNTELVVQAECLQSSE